MAIHTVQAAERNTTDVRARALRREGGVPCQVYGGTDENRHLRVDAKEFSSLMDAEGEGIVIELKGDGFAEPCIVQELQRHPVTNAPVHVDFLRIKMDEKVEITVPLEFVGTSPAVKELSGVLVKNTSEVEIEALPAAIPKVIEVDLTSLVTFDDKITIADLVAPKGVEILSDAGLTVAIVDAPRSDAELEALNEEVVEDVDAVEAANVKKDEEEGAEGDEKTEGDTAAKEGKE